MIKSILIFFVSMFCAVNICFSQADNIPLDNGVYQFLKNMSVKHVIGSINDQDPVLSRMQVEEYLDEIEDNYDELSYVERRLLKKYQVELIFYEQTEKNTTVLIDGDGKFSERAGDIFSDKQKYLYRYERGKSNLSFDLLGRAEYINTIKPDTKLNGKILEVGFRGYGTFFGHLGYSLMVRAAGVWGDRSVLTNAEPWLRYNYKYNELTDEFGSYTIVNGYTRYQTEPGKNMLLAIEIGKERIKTGYSYDQSLVISDNGPEMDFIKFNYNWGIMRFNSYTASTVGPFVQDRSKNYTKFIAANQIVFSIPKVFDIGIGEQEVYSGRGLDIGYLTPFGFYKYLEQDLQDRDNGTFYLTFQTNFIKNLQFNGTAYLDENFIGKLNDFSLATNKVAFQIGAMTYAPFGLDNLSLQFAYTYIRPYVYSHINPQNSITGFGTILGNEIGPNGDRIFTRLSYYFSEKIKFDLTYAHSRKGNNIYDAQGNLIKNVGGDVFLGYNIDTDNKYAPFLDGARVNTDNIAATLRIEPIRGFVFDINYTYNYSNNLYKKIKSDNSFAFMRLLLDY